MVDSVQFSTDLKDGQKIETVLGQELTVSIVGGVVKIDGATVTIPNVITKNGVVHVIDQVMVPGPTSPTNSTAPTAAGPTAATAPTAADDDDEDKRTTVNGASLQGAPVLMPLLLVAAAAALS